KLSGEEIPFRMTLSISPTFLSMCLDPLLQKRAVRYVDQLLGLARKEEKRIQSHPEFKPVVQMYLEKLERYRRDLIEKFHCNVAEGFKRFSQSGRLELITCAATHGFLPLLGVREAAVRGQVETALELHKSFFGKEPAGFWLPECGYQPGLDDFLGEYGLRYFFVETHGLLEAQPRPKYGTFAPIRCPSGLAAFGRDMESSKQVWSSKEGYPGDPDYREFYRDVGFDLTEGELHPYLQPEGIRRFTGLKYYRVTGPGDQKEPYNPSQARQRAEAHAADFLSNRRKQVATVSQWMDRPPLVTCMYDAELFGHWWYEGPDFLYSLFEQNHRESGGLSFVSPLDYLEKFPENQPSQPVFSSWGLGGYAEFWLNEANDWLYPLLSAACDEMSHLADQFQWEKGVAERALRQATREILLAQASDWAFMLKTGNHKSYAERRVKGHLARFHQLSQQIRRGRIDGNFLSDLEEKDNLFPAVNPGAYKSPSK
ncbi:MAG TPA: 1,4-alpha-glucan branching protein domain-containing protein, partial [bacterium]|nr:1,4-alpha-glucan branching protein domain-containing protein [bacterium]